MPITVNIYYTGQSGSARAFAQEMLDAGVVTDIRAEEGNLRYEYFLPLEDPETILLIDSWTDQAAIDAHHASPMMARLAALRESDAILREEIEAAGMTIWQFFTVVPDFRSTGVRDGKRAFDWPVIIRAVNTVDAMTATVPEIPWTVLQKITGRILAEVPGVCRVLYDLTPKPVGTIEWE